MRVLVVGNGAREHALLWCLKQSPSVAELFAAPGNAGTGGIATNVPIDASSIIDLASFAEELRIGLTIVGPELPLTLGIVDEFHKRDLHCFGPTHAAAELEGSKVFAKEFMRANGIPTADFVVCGSAEEAFAALDARGDQYPVVIKADGLAAGKGVFVVADRAEANLAVERIMVARAFGNAGARLLIEDCLVGDEVSFQVLVDGVHALPLAGARDYKRAEDGDFGPNTGGMGAISPSRSLKPEHGREIMTTIVHPTVEGMRAIGRPFLGVLYVGLMLTADGPRVLEYNVRFGDPETQSILPRLQTDPVELFMATLRGHLDRVKLEWRKEVSLSVVMASGGYPGKIQTGLPITGLAEVAKMPVQVFHGATAREGHSLVTVGGRVLTVNACAPNLKKAREVVYAAVDCIRFEHKQYRTDIGASGEGSGSMSKIEIVDPAEEA